MTFNFIRNRPYSKKLFPELCEVFPTSLATVMMAFFLSACISSTLDLNNDPLSVESFSAIVVPVPMAKSEIDKEWLQLQVLRREAIAEIHAKARSVSENETAPLYVSPEKIETNLSSPEEISNRIEEIDTALAQSDKLIQDSELKLKRHKMSQLLQKGKTHYKSALKRIEKK